MFKKIYRFCFRKRNFRSKIALLIVGIVIVFYILIITLNEIENTLEEEPISISEFQSINQAQELSKDDKYPIVIWWTPFTGDSGSFKKCGHNKCFFTDQRKYFSDPRTRAFLFYGSDFKPTDLPLPRSPLHDWALLHEESPKNNFLFSMEKVMKLFNHTATFRRESDLPLTLQYLESLEPITSTKYFVPTSAKNDKGKTIAPVVYLHSDCNTPSERDSYVEELMKIMSVDSYGKCLQNRPLPSHLADPARNMLSHEVLELLSQYKFHLAFENAVCDDYITEKLWRPLTVGSVPVYFGSPSVEDWLPNPESAILIKNFRNPKHLAEHLMSLHSDTEAYERHLEHKTKGKITNQRLKDAMAQRDWGINNDPNQKNFIECFECLVCRRVAENFRRDQKNIERLKFRSRFEHYGCPKPVGNNTLKTDGVGWWPELYDKAVYEAHAMEKLMARGRNYSSTDFYQEVIDLLENGIG